MEAQRSNVGSHGDIDRVVKRSYMPDVHCTPELGILMNYMKSVREKE